jgi:hypothetical protein
MTTFTTADRIAVEENKCKEKHCWHDTPNILLSYPPQTVRVCCNCGVKDVIKHEIIKSFEGHGIYHPFNMIVTTPKGQSPIQTKYGALYYETPYRDESTCSICDGSCVYIHGTKHESPYQDDRSEQKK